jgi:hypothetical protein
MMPTEISLQEYLEGQIEGLRFQMCQWEKAHSEKHALELAVHNTERDNTKRALEVQSSEYARRLEILNGEAGRLHSMQMTYLPRELHEASNRDVSAQIDRLRKEIEELRLFRENIKGQMVAYSAAISLAISIIMFVASKLLK